MELVRAVALIGCVGLLFGLFVFGATVDETGPGPVPGEELAASGVDPADHAGEEAELWGVVVDTDPVVVEIESDEETERVVVDGAPAVEEGEQLIVGGTLTADGSLDANRDRAVVRAPWERTYMYAISVVGALLVVARGIDGWRLDPRTLTVHPRETPLHRRYLDRDSREGHPDG